MSSRTGPIRQVLSELLAPLVAKEGGSVYFMESEDGVLTLHWAGRYSGNPATALIHEEIAVPLIQEIAPGTIVKWSSGRLVPTDAELVEPRLTATDGMAQESNASNEQP